MSAMKDVAIELDNRWAEVKAARVALSNARAEEHMAIEWWNFCDYHRPDDLPAASLVVEEAAAARVRTLEHYNEIIERNFS